MSLPVLFYDGPWAAPSLALTGKSQLCGGEFGIGLSDLAGDAVVDQAEPLRFGRRRLADAIGTIEIKALFPTVLSV